MKTTLFESAEELNEYDDEEFDPVELTQTLEHYELMLNGLSNLEDIKNYLSSKSNITKEDYNNYLIAYDQFINTFNIPDPFGKKMAIENYSNFNIALENISGIHTKIAIAMESVIMGTLRTAGNNIIYLISLIDNYEKKLYNIRQMIDNCSNSKKATVTFRPTLAFSHSDGILCKNITDYKKELKKSVINLKDLVNKFDIFIAHNGIFSDIRAFFSYFRAEEGEMKFLGPYLEIYKKLMNLVEVNGMHEGGNDYVSENFLGEWYTSVLGYKGFKEANSIYLEKNEKDINLKLKHMRSLLLRVYFVISYDKVPMTGSELVFTNVTKKDLMEIYEDMKDLGESLNDFKRLGNKFRVLFNSMMELSSSITAIKGLVIPSLVFSAIFARAGLVFKTATLVNISTGNLFQISRRTILGVEKFTKAAVRELK